VASSDARGGVQAGRWQARMAAACGGDGARRRQLEQVE
jgi:hypothetical protein